MRYLFCLFFMINSAIAQPDNIDKIIYLAEQNHPIGQVYLGAYYESTNSKEHNISKAIELYTKAVEQNNSLGQAFLATCYVSGDGVEKDFNKAFELFTKSAEQNDPKGQAYLGLCYHKGMGIKKDILKAVATDCCEINH